jgi:hypothetical protein
MKDFSSGFDENPETGLRHKIPHGGWYPPPPSQKFSGRGQPPLPAWGEVGGTTPPPSEPVQHLYPISGMAASGAFRRELHAKLCSSRWANMYVTHSRVGGERVPPPHLQKIRRGGRGSLIRIRGGHLPSDICLTGPFSVGTPCEPALAYLQGRVVVPPAGGGRGEGGSPPQCGGTPPICIVQEEVRPCPPRSRHTGRVKLHRPFLFPGTVQDTYSERKLHLPDRAVAESQCESTPIGFSHAGTLIKQTDLITGIIITIHEIYPLYHPSLQSEVFLLLY